MWFALAHTMTPTTSWAYWRQGDTPIFPIFPESQAERGGLAHFGVKMGKNFAKFRPKTHVPKSENWKFAEIFIAYLTKI
jgi:hypothetical protein